MHAMRYFRDTRSPNCNSTLRKASYQNLSSLFAPQAGDKSFILLEKVSSAHVWWKDIAEVSS